MRDLIIECDRVSVSAHLRPGMDASDAALVIGQAKRVVADMQSRLSREIQIACGTDTAALFDELIERTSRFPQSLDCRYGVIADGKVVTSE